MKSRTIRSVIRRLAASLCALAALGGPALAAGGGEPEGGQPSAGAPSADVWDTIRYSAYRAAFPSQEPGTDSLELTGDQAADRSGETALLDAYAGKTGALLQLSEGGEAAFEFTISAAGVYNFEVDYYLPEGSGEDARCQWLIDGALPFREAAEVAFERVWMDEDGKPYYLDSRGNQIRSPQVPVPGWRSQRVLDKAGVTDDPYAFYLTEGAHTLRVKMTGETMVAAAIRVTAPDEPVSYQEYRQACEATYGPVADGGKRITLQAETIARKSAPTIYGSSNRASADVQPAPGTKLVLNELNGSKFSQVGSWVDYDFHVEQAGYYRLHVKYQQSYKDGAYSCRRFYLDGEQPFREASGVRFFYADTWSSLTVGGEEPYYLYLTAGDHTLTLQAVLGDMADIINRSTAIVDRLNDAYWNLYVITGPDPDPFRDYNFKKTAAKEIAVLDEESDRLSGLMEDIVALTGKKSSFISTLQRLLTDMEKMVQAPDTIAQRLSNFIVNLGALSDWVLELQSQPLDLDYIELLPVGADPQPMGAGLWANLQLGLRLFLDSFITDYSNIVDGGEAGRESLTVWLGNTGRDQANIVKQLIDGDFTGRSGYNVKLQFVSAAASSSSGTLLPSILAGIGPDVYLFAAASEPINFALRNAVYDLRSFKDFDQVAERFSPGSLTPYSYKGAVYGLPETVSFPVMFYRQDIFKKLDLQPPETWDEAYDVILQLQARNLTFGMLTENNGYYMFLHQLGGSVFNEAGTAVRFGESTGVEAFKMWTDFFTSYKLSNSYSFINRFRTGEMPIGLIDFSTANQLYVSAPELRGLFRIAPVPGIRGEDGVINNKVALDSTANMMLAGTDHPQAAWEFMKWWSGTDVQSEYAEQLESVLGVVARYATANVEAFSAQSWSRDELAAINRQRQAAVGIPEVPGSYILPRYLTFAYNAVVNNAEDPARVLTRNTRKINAELTRKQKQFEKKVRQREE